MENMLSKTAMDQHIEAIFMEIIHKVIAIAYPSILFTILMPLQIRSYLFI
jgi:hypothetical protein